MGFLSRLTPALAICNSNAATTVERRRRECGGGFCLKIHSCLKITRNHARRRLADGNYKLVEPGGIFAPQIVAVHGVAAGIFGEVSSAEPGTRRCPLYPDSQSRHAGQHQRCRQFGAMYGWGMNELSYCCISI
jgi:hypothetical protein